MKDTIRYFLPHTSTSHHDNSEFSFGTIEEKRKVVARIYDIFNKHLPINNVTLLKELIGVQEEFFAGFSYEEKEKYDEYSAIPSLIEEKLGNFSSIDALEEQILMLDGDEDVSDEFRERMNLRYDEIQDLEDTQKGILTQYWKIDLLLAVKRAIGKLQDRISIINAYKAGEKGFFRGVFRKYPKTLQAIEEGKAKVFYTAFGVTFILDRSHSDKRESVGGYYISGSPFSVIFSSKDRKKPLANTLNHEVRHNIFDLLELPGSFSQSEKVLGERMIQRIESLKGIKQRLERLKALNAPNIIIEDNKRLFNKGFTGIITSYIFGLRDEILANYDYLLLGRGSTDMNHSASFLRFLTIVDAIFEGETDTDIIKLKEQFKVQAKRQLIGFFKKLSFYLYIARNSSVETKEVIRQLMYLSSDIQDFRLLDVYLSEHIGPDIYRDLHKSYHLLSLIKLDEILLQEDSARALMSLLYGSIDKEKDLTDDTLRSVYNAIQYFRKQRNDKIDVSMRNIVNEIINKLGNENPWKNKFYNLKRRMSVDSGTKKKSFRFKETSFGRT